MRGHTAADAAAGESKASARAAAPTEASEGTSRPQVEPAAVAELARDLEAKLTRAREERRALDAQIAELEGARDAVKTVTELLERDRS